MSNYYSHRAFGKQARPVANALARFIWCRLYGVRCVDRFPPGCPLGEPDPCTAIRAILERGWQRIGRQLADGHDDFARAKVCQECMARRRRPAIGRRLAGHA